MTSRAGIRLCVVLDQPFWHDGTRYSTNATFIRFVLSFSERVGELVIMAPLIRTRSERGHFDVELPPATRFVPFPPFRTAKEMYMRGFSIIPRMLRTFRESMESWDVAWFVSEHIQNLLMCRAAALKGKKAFLYIRSNIVKDIRSHRYVGREWILSEMMLLGVRFFLRRALRRGIPALVTGEELAIEFGSLTSRIHKVYPSIINEADIVPEPRGRDRDGPITLIAVGRVTPEKGLEILVRALDILVHRLHMRVRCTIVGTGKDEGRIKKLVGDVGLASEVAFTGFVQPGAELFELYDKADIYVMPSHSEGLPKTVYEALARGLPVVASRVGGLPEIIREGREGYLVEPGNPEAFAEAVGRLISDPQLRERISRQCIERAGEFTLQRQRDRMMEIIREDVLA